MVSTMTDGDAPESEARAAEVQHEEEKGPLPQATKG